MEIRNFLCRVFGKLGITKNHWPTFLLEYANMQLYKQKQSYTFDINNPVLFTEKIQWQKTRFNRPDLVRYVDKYLFKELIKENSAKAIPSQCMAHGRVWDHLEKSGILCQSNFV